MSTTIGPRSEPIPSAEDFRTYSGRIFRMVEAQHSISTSRLADSLIDEERLEALVEQVKPDIPTKARGLHHLLATPFRYGHRSPSRFRAATERPGIYYASERMEACLSESVYWRLRFFAASPGATLPATTAEYLSFSVGVRADRALDLTKRPFVADRELWTRSDDYRPCQRFAAAARAIDAQIIRYESVRDPMGTANVALLDPACFRDKVPKAEQVWHFRFQSAKLIAIASGPSPLRREFSFAQFGLAAPATL